MKVEVISRSMTYPGIAVIHLTIINLQIEVDFQSTVKKHTKLENSNIDCLD